MEKGDNRMKEYKIPELILIRFQSEDVLAGSGPIVTPIIPLNSQKAAQSQSNDPQRM